MRQDTVVARPTFINLAQAADRLGVSTLAAEDLVRRNLLDARIFVTAESVDEYLRTASHA